MHRRLLDLTRDTRLALSLTILSGLMAGWLTIGQSYVLSRTISDVFLKGLTLAEVWPWMRILLAIISGRGVLAWVSELAADSVAIRIKTDLRERLFAHILRLGPAYSRGERTGELTAAAVEGIESLDAYFSQYLPQLVVSTLVPVSILMLVFPLDPLSGIVLVLTAPLIPFFMYMIGRGAEAVTKRQYETLSKLSAHFLDSLQGLTTLKLFGQSKAQARNIAHISDQYRDATLQVLQVTFLSAFALELLATISTAIIAVEVGLRLLYGQMQFQQALFLLILAPEFYLPLRMLGLRFHAGMAGTSAARRIFEILDLRVDGFHEFAPGAGTRTGAMRKSDAFRLELCDVSYTYPGEKEPALKDVTLSLRAGQHIAVVGPSGAGKTTLVNVLLRFVEPTLGGITLNGDPLCNVPVEEWRDLIAWVPQSPHLFHDSIAANIRFGNNGASDQELMAAAMAAHLDEFVGSLPDGYDTVIGEAGARLSSGQAQRLALARAFAKDAPILILDEPTSNMDPETESLLEDSTRRLMAGRTVITVAHRLNTVVHADQIIVLKDGSVVEAGTHRELLQRNGVYSRTVKIQHSADQIPGDNLILRPEAFSYRPAPRVHQPAYSQQSESPEVRAAEDTSMRHPSVLFRLLTFLDGSWGWVALSVLLGSFTIGSGVALMAASSWLISTAALHPSIAALELAIAGVRFFGIARAVFRYFERLVSHNVTLRLLGRLRAWFYESLEPLAPARLMEYRAGDLLARIVSDVNTLENFYVRVVGPPATAILVGLGAALFLSAIDPPLAAVLLASFLLLGWVLPVVVLRMSKHRSLEAVAQRSELQAQLVDGIQGISDILAFGQGPPRVAQIQATGRRYADAQRQLGMIGGAQTAVVTLITGLASWLILCIAIPAVASGQIPGVMLAPLALLASSSFEAVAPLSVAAQAWSSTREAARRLFDVVDASPAVQEKGERGAVVNQRLPGNRAVEFSDVSFSYPGKETPVLQHVSFGLKAGETLAVVGTSGAGKSTLASLLLRFWDFELGEIWLHGKSIKALAPEEVRARIALISPSTYFFNTSIYENLRMARRGVSREDVEGAARAAQIHDFIMGLPEGYDTAIGEQGMRLSGGERQRLAVARAILKDAPILVMDEPTANLDALSESLVIASLSGWMERKSTLWITHRLVGLERVHEILVLDHGQIVERGSHGSLLNGHGLYRRLWDLQNQYLGDDERA